MINLRYHIVSITAVFLALGIGVALGSTLIERATVDTLNDRLDEQSERLDRTDGENAELREELARIDELEQQLTEQGVALYPGHLAEVPLVLLTLQGTDDALVDQTRRSLQASGAAVTGVLRFTSRWETLSQEEVADLATLLDRPLIRGPETREATLAALAEELLVASEPDPAADEADTGAEDDTDPDLGGAVGPDGELDAADEETTTSTTSAGTGVPSGADDNGTLLDALLERGFMEYIPDGSTTPLPAHGARYAFVLGDSEDVGVEEVVLPFVEAMAEAEPAPLVVVETLAAVEDDADAEPADQPFAGPAITAIRSDELLVVSVSTADSAAGFVGQSAMILALADLVGDDPVVGQYGVAVGATSLLPPLGE